MAVRKPVRAGGARRGECWPRARLLPRSRRWGGADGCESWRGAAHLLKGFSIGAPPDGFTREGQNWGLPPPDPLRWKADGCESFGELLRANMRHAGALRMDHVMGLARLFVVPDGGKPPEGAYLSYPLDNLLAELALESERAKCMVIGEDLGTLPWAFPNDWPTMES